MLEKEKLLLHSCCGPCSTSVIRRLILQYQVSVFFYNPCITEREEYERRKANQVLFLEKYNSEHLDTEGFQPINFIEGDYIPDDFFQAIKGFEHCKEGEERCPICYEQRLEHTCLKAKELGYQYFTTTLSVSPHKKFQIIKEIGEKLAEKHGVDFLALDFKKQAGYHESTKMSRDYGLYRQDYCGCIFSKIEREEQKKASLSRGLEK